MGRISKVLREAEDGHGAKTLLFYCAGCGMAHQVWVGTGPGPRWGWNGDANKPSFTPSVLGTSGLIASDGGPRPLVCHSFVTDGRIQYLSDSTHALAGKTVDLQEFRWGPDDPDE